MSGILSNSGVGLIAGGIIAGLVVLAGLYVAIMALYFYIRKRRPNSKFSVEVWFILITLLCSATVKVAIFSYIYGPTFDGGFAAFIMGVYDSIGGFTFGNHPDVTETLAVFNDGALRGFLQCLYTGTIVLTSLIFISIVSAKVSYEIYSYLRLFGSEKGKDVYVFTALNEEALEMAESIKDQHEDEKRRAKQYNKENKHKENFVKKKACDFKIIFAGPSIQPFDRKNELCRRVMAKGFLYWSYIDDNESSIVKKLHLNNGNFGNYDVDCCVFAFETNDHVPMEEQNFDVVIEDANRRIKMQNRDSIRVEYFILSKDIINYQAYQERIDELKEDYSKKFNDEIVSIANAYIAEHQEEFFKLVAAKKVAEPNFTIEKLKENVKEEIVNGFKTTEFAKRYVFHVWNEANIVAKSAVQKVMKSGLRESLKDKTKGLYVCSIGFGGVAEAITNKFFTQSPGVFGENPNDNYAHKIWCSRPYVVHAFDKNDDSFGIFRGRHVDYTYVDVDNEQSAVKKIKSALDTEKYSRQGMPAPIYCLERIDACGQKFWDRTLKEINDAPSEDLLSAPDIFVVATGSDSRNIKIASSLIQKIVNRAADQGMVNKKRKQYVVVNLFDIKNNDLISKFKGKSADGDPTIFNVFDKANNNYLTIVIVGNMKETYSFKDYMESEESAALLNYTYLRAYDRTRTENFVFVSKKGDPIKPVGINQDIRNFIQNMSSLVTDGKKIKDGVKDLANKPTESTEIINLYLHFYFFKQVFNALKNSDKHFFDVALSPNDNIVQEKFIDTILWFKKETEKADMIKYDGISLWEKFSNHSTVEALPLYYDMYAEQVSRFASKDPKSITLDQLEKEMEFFFEAAQIEHDRWVRLHMSDGWVYSKKDKSVKHHDCIIPFSKNLEFPTSIDVDKADTAIFDFLNVIWAVASVKRANNNQQE